jgi:hypothetical protein
MLTIGFSIKLTRINESLLYKDPAGNFWLSGVLTIEEDDKGRTIIVQSIPKERFAAGERGPAIGTWRELVSSKPTAQNSSDNGLGILRAAQEAERTAKAYLESQEQLFPKEA